GRTLCFSKDIIERTGGSTQRTHERRMRVLQVCKCTTREKCITLLTRKLKRYTAKNSSVRTFSSRDTSARTCMYTSCISCVGWSVFCSQVQQTLDYSRSLVKPSSF
ncbi:unnamed protein product, partial [Ectocarpus sp. 4 AP-2014]